MNLTQNTITVAAHDYSGTDLDALADEVAEAVDAAVTALRNRVNEIAGQHSVALVVLDDS